MKPSEWIWLFGDFELHHLLKVNSRRFDRDWARPAPWRMDDCWHNVHFHRVYQLAQDETIRIRINGIGCTKINNVRYSTLHPITLKAGRNDIFVEACNLTGLPAIFVEGDTVRSDESWTVSYDFCNYEPVDCQGYTDPTLPPDTFAFAYQPLPLTVLHRGARTLYDAGQETMARLTLRFDGTGTAVVYYGESEAEALDDEPYTCETVEVRPVVTLPTRAFRYLRVETDGAVLTDIAAEYEYLPLETRGVFRCDDARINRIWDISRYTLHLNTREFFLDGIKRDRYVWSGDAYQSYLLNYYLFFDNDACKRTTLALRGKDPMSRHINTIMDYSFYWVLGLKDYLLYTGDLDFIRRVYPMAVSLLQFCIGRANAQGRMPQRRGDWIFIDWANNLDKSGVNTCEQMLFAAALETTVELGRKIGADTADFADRAAALRDYVQQECWSDALGAYIDCPESGLNRVTRQTNLFALRFGFDGDGRRAQILKNALYNDAVPQITTPYFKFYELEALGVAGDTAEVLQRMRDYWGGMLDLGATSFWEEYKPDLTGDAHYAMYNQPYGKSLCHAWGASPVYLLGRFFLGVVPTSDGYRTYTVAPSCGGLNELEGIVPTPRGDIRVCITAEAVAVEAPFDGGTLYWNGIYTPIPAGETVRIAR